jgi:AraC family transcriptional regulator
MPETDTFARFVDVLASSLDEDVDTDELATRVHFSRSHVDRVVKAVSGESPGRFRRRVLMERAAYRLLTDDRTLIDIAVEAGYSSHEAFTRAFERGYGRPPSVWRRDPGRPLLPSSTGVHFHPPGGLRLPATRKVTSMDLVVTMTEHHIWLIGQMLDRASRVDETTLDGPIGISVEGIDRDPTLRSLLSRLVGQMDMWNAAVANRPYDFDVEQHETLDSMRARLSEAGPVYLGHVRDACASDRLEDTFVDATGETPQAFTYGQMIAHVITYAAHRRTIVTGALYTAGETDLDDDPLFWAPLIP